MNETSTGSNRPANDTSVLDRLKKDYAVITSNVAQLAEQAAALPVDLQDDEQQGKVSNFIKEVRSTAKRAEGARVAEKEVFLEGGRQVDGFFKTIDERLSNMAARLNDRITTYLNKKAAAERAAREKEAERLRQEEAQRLKDAEEAAQRQREAQAKLDAEQAKSNPSNFDVMEAADEKAEAKAEENTAIGDAIDLGNRADEVQASALAKPADLARTRSDVGVLSTLATTWKFAIEDYDKIPLESLRAYLSNADVEKAIRAYVRKHKGSKPLAGVRIYEETSAVVR